MDKFEVFLIDEIKVFMDKCKENNGVDSWAMLNIYDELIEVLCKYRSVNNE